MKSTALVVCEQMTLVREALQSLLSAASPPGAVQAAATLDGAIALLDAAPQGLLLLDLTLLGAAGPIRLVALRKRFPALRIIVLAPEATRDGILQCLAAGAHGYIAKSASFDDLLRAIAAVRDGGIHVPLALVAADTPAPRSVAPPFADRLTGRQRDVLMLMAEGRTTKDIARTLDLAVSTIKVHLAAVYRAVGARNRVEALCRAGLLPARARAQPAM